MADQTPDLMAALRASLERPQNAPADPPSAAVEPPAAPGTGTDTPEAHTAAHGPGSDFPHVAGRCPTCRGTSLFLGAGGHVTCSRLDCPDPVRADQILHGELPRADPRCDTCSGTGWIKQEGQIGVPGSGCTHGCPDCEVGQARLARRELLETDDLATDTPEAHSGAEGLILGRAWMDREGEVWKRRSDLGDAYPAREVLLVPVEAGPVLEAALEVVACTSRGTPEWAQVLTDLAAAVDAATSGQPANVATEETTAAQPPPRNSTYRDQWRLHAYDEAGRGNVAAAGRSPIETVRRREWAAALRWEADQLLDAADNYERSDLRQADASRHAANCLEIGAHRIEAGALTPWTDQPDPQRKPAADDAREPGTSLHPEPAGDGPGWERQTIGHLIGWLSKGTGWPQHLDQQGIGRQLDALLADRDRLAEVVARVRQLADNQQTWIDAGRVEQAISREAVRDTLRRLLAGVDTHVMSTVERELAEVTAQAETAYRAMVAAQRERDEARAKTAELTADRNRLSIDLEQAQDRIALMRSAVEEAGRERDAARRNGAADALEEAANDANTLMRSSRVFAAADLRQRAADIRSGEREIPTRQDGGF